MVYSCTWPFPEVRLGVQTEIVCSGCFVSEIWKLCVGDLEFQRQRGAERTKGERAKEGFTNLTGVDYVENAVILAKELAAKEAVSVLFEVGDILEQDLPCPSFSRKYDFVLDKGTYDAISLCPDNPQKKRRCYLEVLSQILATGGHFVIVSCNWTQQELTAHFKRDLVLLDTIPTPTFSFGGSQGKSVTALVFVSKSPMEKP
ncbi:EEF1A lysine methyltransferase 2 isoform X3 [Dermacentor variabilis]|uniref:EEF1A lysine methyltransferase 2 isoform X3 n=1 Tax=Dermacentor variabilis TaxID=34621 RepID=UPI003F5B0C6D